MSILSQSTSPVDSQDPTPVAGEFRLFESATVYATANVLSSAIPFVLLPVLTRVLSPADFGMVAMFSVLQILFLPLAGLSSKHAVAAHFFGPGGSDITHFLTACLLLTTVSSAGLALLVFLFREVLTSMAHLSANWLLLAVAAAAAQVVILLTLALWQARRNAVRFGVFQVLHSATNLGLSLLFVLSLGLG
jgi:O-antigen/teichoic acid export membrane protein